MKLSSLASLGFGLIIILCWIFSFHLINNFMNVNMSAEIKRWSLWTFFSRSLLQLCSSSYWQRLFRLSCCCSHQYSSLETKQMMRIVEPIWGLGSDHAADVSGTSPKRNTKRGCTASMSHSVHEHQKRKCESGKNAVAARVRNFRTRNLSKCMREWKRSISNIRICFHNLLAKIRVTTDQRTRHTVVANAIRVRILSASTLYRKSFTNLNTKFVKAFC